MIDRCDYWYFAERAILGMRGIVADLGDDRAAQKPPFAGANSPYALLHHCLAVVDTWVGGFIAGRPIDRDRSSEFQASGPVDELLERVDATLRRFRADLADVDPAAPLTQVPPPEYEGPDRALTTSGALQHVYEELAQHHGQMEQIRDLLLAVEAGRVEVR